MAYREITVEIAVDGSVRGELAGFPGTTCRDMAAVLADIVGETISFEPGAECFEVTTAEADIDLER